MVHVRVPMLKKTIPLVPIHLFTRQIVPLVCEELLNQSS